MDSSTKSTPVPTAEGAYALLHDGCPTQDFEVPGAWRALEEKSYGEVCATPVVSVGVYTKDHSLYGAVVARGLIRGRCTGEPGQEVVELMLDWPVVQAWGYGQQDFLKDRAAASCVMKYAREAFTVYGKLPKGPAVLLEFSPEWNDESIKGLKSRFIQAFNAMRFSAAPHQAPLPPRAALSC